MAVALEKKPIDTHTLLPVRPSVRLLLRLYIAIEKGKKRKDTDRRGTESFCTVLPP